MEDSVSCRNERQTEKHNVLQLQGGFLGLFNLELFPFLIYSANIYWTPTHAISFITFCRGNRKLMRHDPYLQGISNCMFASKT